MTAKLSLLLAVTCTITANTNFEPAYNPADTLVVEVRAPWYQDKQGNIVINPGWFETLYDQNGLEAVPGASWQCRQSLHDAPEDAIVLCIKPRQDKPKNEPTPSFNELMHRGY